MKPILFNTEMVKKILDGEKTVTRRVVKPQHLQVLDSQFRKEHHEVPEKTLIEKLCIPPYCPGDILYVRETWSKCNGVYIYKTHCKNKKILEEVRNSKILWSPSIHMPKEAARIFLRVNDVRVERLQDITDIDVEKEGFETEYDDSVVKLILPARKYFSVFWDRTIKKSDLHKYGWDANPFSWRISFERISREEALSGEKQ